MIYFGLRWELDEYEYEKFIKKLGNKKSTASLKVDIANQYGLVIKHTCDEDMSSEYIATIYLPLVALNGCEICSRSFDNYFGREFKRLKGQDPRIQQAIDIMNKCSQYVFCTETGFAIFNLE